MSVSFRSLNRNWDRGPAAAFFVTAGPLLVKNDCHCRTQDRVFFNHSHFLFLSAWAYMESEWEKWAKVLRKQQETEAIFYGKLKEKE